MHRFLLPHIQPDASGRVDLSPVAHQLARVLRAVPGDQVVVLDDSSTAYTVELVAVDRHQAWGEVRRRQTLPEPQTQLTLYQCGLKADKFEWILQKGTELGVTCFVPILSARTVVRPLAALEKKRSRWEAILREATEQCGRGRMPYLAPAQTWASALDAPPIARPDPMTQSVPSPAPGTLKLLPWEDTAAAAQSAPGLGETIAHWLNLHPALPRHVACCIGPEGGFDAAEVAAAQQAGWTVVNLGPRILRAETAALAATTIIMQLSGELTA